MKYQDVFIAGGFPKHTYNPRADLGLEQRLRESREKLCKLVTVTGQTKSGKTVLARSIFPREECVWVDGGSVSAEDDFWQVVLEQLDLFQTTEEETGSGTTATIAAKGNAGANFIVAKGSAEVGGELAKARSQSRTRARSVSPKIAALHGLSSSQLPVVIDDFHYLPKQMQGHIVRALKQLIFDGLPVIIIAIPHRRYDAVRVEKEMTGRVLSVNVPVWTNEELTFIPATGFELLGLPLDRPIPTRMAAEAIGSPHLVQDFCRTTCRMAGVGNGQPYLDKVDLERVFRDVADISGRPIFDKLARGPRQRSDRIQRKLTDGRVVDIYQLVLHALARLRPGLVSIEYEELRSAIRDVADTQVPQLQEVARVLKHMATIAASDESSTPVIDFEEDEKKLHITDPFFAFYLRWGQLSDEQ